MAPHILGLASFGFLLAYAACVAAVASYRPHGPSVRRSLRRVPEPPQDVVDVTVQTAGRSPLVVSYHRAPTGWTVTVAGAAGRRREQVPTWSAAATAATELVAALLQERPPGGPRARDDDATATSSAAGLGTDRHRDR